MGGEDDKRWHSFRKIFLQTELLMQFDFSEGAKEITIPYREELEGLAKSFGVKQDLSKYKLPKLSEVLPFIFGKVL
jgi:hypothetical protein